MSDVADVALGKMLDKAKRTRGMLLPYLRNANVRWRAFDLSDLLQMPFEADELERYKICTGDVLVCEGGEPGRAAVWRLLDERIKYQKALLRIRPERGVLPDWLVYSLWRDATGGELEQYFTGSTIKHFPKQSVASYELPLPPAAEQKRIVAQVEELLAHVNPARARLARVPAILRRFRQTLLTAACTGKLTEDWRHVGDHSKPAADLLDHITEDRRKRLGSAHPREAHAPQQPTEEDPYEIPRGWLFGSVASLCQPERALTYGVIKLGPSVPNGVPTLRSSDVRALRIDTSAVKAISAKIASEYARTTLRGGEVLVTVRGTLGGVGVVPGTMTGWNVSREVAVLPVEPRLEAPYLAFAIASPQSQNWLAERVKGAAYTGINIEDLRLLPVPIPPLHEQQQIVRRVQALFSIAEAIQKRLATAADRADRLTQAILARAFNGELVPTEAELARQEGRDYEPASVLLARIKTGRAREEQESAARNRYVPASGGDHAQRLTRKRPQSGKRGTAPSRNTSGDGPDE